ncbi:primosomal protein N' [Candidatus Poribacteria bacterium]|nr:primosomal protein N' [Candidatus Poribacteria bacterium]
MLNTLRRDGAMSIAQLKKKVSEPSFYAALAQLEAKGLIRISSELSESIQPKTALAVKLAKSINETQADLESISSQATKQVQILELLISEYRAGNSSMIASELTRRAETNLTTIRALEKKGLVICASIEVIRDPLSSEQFDSSQPLELNSEQAYALKEILTAIEQIPLDCRLSIVDCRLKVGAVRPCQPSINNQQSSIINPPEGGIRRPIFLLHGVTGSGKTEVYMQAMAEVLKRGKRVIVLVPEIALTPQTVARFAARFGRKITVLHSQLSPGERYDQWRRVKSGEVDIIVGPRSAIFAPAENLGLIIIDEEHETTYKQDEPPPRYYAREVAIKRAELANCVVILGSATPSLESYYKAMQGEYRLLNLKNRVDNIAMPPVEIIDMRVELKQKNNRSIFSERLRTAIEERLAPPSFPPSTGGRKGGQVILFLNRRGFSSYVFCRECGHVERCEQCSISLTYHFDTKLLVCHHCNHERPTPKECPDCFSPYIRYLGIGTQKVEIEIQKAFPTARIARMDTDTTTRKGAHKSILDAFKNGEFDILVGTQMIAKGLDFPNVTLVGVINADIALNLPDFRSGERAFNLLTQVAGRSGRSMLGGNVIIQTYNPDHYSIQAAQEHDYQRFYQEEIALRASLLYPPFSHAASILLRGEDEALVIQAANLLNEQMETLKEAQFKEVQIRGPAPAPFAKIKNKYRWHFLLRCADVKQLQELIKQSLQSAPPSVTRGNVEVLVNIDPMSVL